MLSHNADAFGAPFCTCCDEDETSTLYDYTMDKRTHYGNTTFEELCHRAHVAPWEALGKPEPAEWSFTCPCCGEVRQAHPICAHTRISQPTCSPPAAALRLEEKRQSEA